MSRKQTVQFATMAVATVVMLAAAALAPSRLVGQGAPTVLYGCYVPNSGTAYRIKADGLPSDCRSKNHVQFTWSLQGPPGPQGVPGPAGIQGVPGPAGPIAGRVVVSEPGYANPGTTRVIVVTCPVGTRLMSGGFTKLANSNVDVFYNAPKQLGTDFSDTEWQIGLNNPTAFPQDFRGFAICVSSQ